MAGRGKRESLLKEITEFLNHVMVMDRSMFPFLIPLVLVAWGFERWLLPFSNWVLLAVSVWATIQYGRFQRQLLVEDLNKRWKQVLLYTSPITPLEQCEWLNKLVMEVWSNFINPKLSKRFSSIVEKRLKDRKPRLIEKIELLDFSLGSTSPNLGLHGTRWSTSGDQKIMRMGFEWDTNSINIMLLAKLAKPLMGTARIVVNSIHIKGDLLFMPVLDGQAVLYSFESPPEVRIGVVFGSGGSQTLPATELPGVSSWLVKLFSDTLVKTMVEPRRRCYSLPPVDLNKKAVGGVISVTVVSASTQVVASLKGSNSGRQLSSVRSGLVEGDHASDGVLQTFIEVELGELTRRTNASPGSSPRWDTNFNMVLHEDVGILKFHLYEWVPNSIKHEYITSLEVKLKYVADDSTTFWALGSGSSVLAKRVESVGQEVEMVIPFEGSDIGELTVRLLLKEWLFSDGSRSLNNSSVATPLRYGSANVQPITGRKLRITVIEGRDLVGKDKPGKSNPYVKLQYGKVLHKTKTVHMSNPVWNQKFEVQEIGGGEYLKIKCFSEDTFSDDNIGSARVNLEGLIEGSLRDIWVPLEKVNTGELRLQIEAVKDEDYERSRPKVKENSYRYLDILSSIESMQSANGGSANGWIELVVIEAKDLIAADLRGTSDPYVRVHYGNLKKRTKVTYKTLSPHWNQILEFPDNGSPLQLHVKDHNALLPTSSIGHCIVEYQRLPPNQMADKWIPLQGVRKGEIHIQITRKVPELEKKSSVDSSMSSLSKAHQIIVQMRQTMEKFQGLIEDKDLEGLSMAVNELEIIQGEQEDYMIQLDTEEALLLNKITEIGQEIYRSSSPSHQEIYNSSPSPSRKS